MRNSKVYDENCGDLVIRPGLHAPDYQTFCFWLARTFYHSTPFCDVDDSEKLLDNEAL